MCDTLGHDCARSCQTTMPQAQEPDDGRLPPSAESTASHVVAESTPLQKTTDRPHPITFRLTIAALVLSLSSTVVSAKSCWQSNEALKLSTLSSQADVQISRLVWTPRSSASRYGRVEFILTNFGKVVASDVALHFNMHLGERLNDAGEPFFHFQHELESRLAPGASTTIGRDSFPLDEVPKELASMTEFFVEGRVLFRDVLTDKVKINDWCYVAQLRTPREKSTPYFSTCAPLKYRTQ